MEPPKLLMRPPPQDFPEPGTPCLHCKKGRRCLGTSSGSRGGDELTFFKKEISNNTVFYNDSTEISQKI